MNRNEVKNLFRDILVSTLERNDVDMDDSVWTKEVDGWNSLSNVVIIAELEKAFHIKFRLKDFKRMDKIGTIIDLIMEKLNQASV